MYIDSSREFKNCFISQLIVRINIAYKEIQVMLVKEKKVTGNLTQKQRYKKLISKDTKNSQANAMFGERFSVVGAQWGRILLERQEGNG